MIGGSHGIGMTSQRTRERLVRSLEEEGIRDRRVLEVIRNTPRHLFVEEALASRAYENTALPIGHGQTISQPWVVARMTELLIADPMPKKVLEIGTGSGYQAAVLAQIVPEVYSVERIQPLLRHARQVLRDLQFRNVHLKHSDGSWGWEANAPFDGIILTASPRVVPQAVLDQLAVGGRLVAPVEGDDGRQWLTVIERSEDGYARKTYEPVVFVPMLSGEVR